MRLAELCKTFIFSELLKLFFSALEQPDDLYILRFHNTLSRLPNKYQTWMMCACSVYLLVLLLFKSAVESVVLHFMNKIYIGFVKLYAEISLFQSVKHHKGEMKMSLLGHSLHTPNQ